MATSLPILIAFDHLPSSQAGAQMAIGPGGFTNISNNADVEITAGKYLRLYWIPGYIARFEFPAVVQITLGVRCYTSSLNANGTFFSFLASSAGGELLHLDCATGPIRLYRGATLLATGSTVVTDGVGRYLEIQVVFHATAGSVVIRLDGQEPGDEEIAITGINTLNGQASCGAAQFEATGNQQNYGFRDIYVREELEFWGSLVPRRLKPTSDVLQQWDPDSGTDHYARVADASGSDGASSYISTQTLDEEDEFGTEDLPAGVNSIVAVTVGSIGDAPSGGNPLVSPTVRQNSVQAVGEAQSLNQYMRQQQSTFLTAPDASAWTEAKVNAMTVGIKAA